jgi:hypothetical protein
MSTWRERTRFRRLDERRVTIAAVPVPVHYAGGTYAFGGPVQVVLDEEMAAEMSCTPVAYFGINPDEDLMPVTFTANLSTNTSMWITIDLDAGMHGLICFFPDLGDGRPHAYHGMYAVVEIEE